MWGSKQEASSTHMRKCARQGQTGTPGALWAGRERPAPDPQLSEHPPHTEPTLREGQVCVVGIGLMFKSN